jgi:hypothetical protein
MAASSGAWDASLGDQPVRRRRVTRQQMGSGAVEQFRRTHDVRIGHSSWFPPINLYQSFYVPP